MRHSITRVTRASDKKLTVTHRRRRRSSMDPPLVIKSQVTRPSHLNSYVESGMERGEGRLMVVVLMG